MYAELSGLPPLLVHAGQAEVLVDQIRDFTRPVRRPPASLSR